MNKSDKVAYMDFVLLKALYDISRLCCLADHIDFKALGMVSTAGSKNYLFDLCNNENETISNCYLDCYRMHKRLLCLVEQME